MNVLYVSYDGLLDPLGASQIVPYVSGLARRGWRYVVITFEKPGAARRAEGAATAAAFASSAVRWRPLVYHRRPRVPATAYDLWRGRRAVSQELRRRPTDIVHCRGDIAMAMSRSAARGTGASLLYDMRGFFAEERCEVGSWRRGGLIDRAVRRSERRNLAAAAGLVVLTRAGLLDLSERDQALPPTRVIPTSVDLGRFTPSTQAAEYGLAYVGSLGTWYLTREMVALARESVSLEFGRPLFLTNQPAEAVAAGASPEWAEVASVSHDRVPDWLRRCRAGFFLIQPSPSKRASCPTKLGEALACGLPVLANAGVGDVAEVLESERVGVAIHDLSPDAFRAGLRRLRALLAEPDTRERCRRVAERRFGLSGALDAYVSLYTEILTPRSVPRSGA